ncbi:MAG TPA: hypothetical protein VKU19_17260 [Bryobacteraceae bacterium]|nr:hypothetical protein [Bryobacteraceae bacterium]
MGEVKRLGLLVCFLGLGAPLFAQDAVASWFPMTVGNHWVYEHEALDGTARSPRVVKWQTDESITGLLALAEGTVVLRYVQYEGETPGSWLSKYGESHYLIRNSCLYFLDGAYSWDAENRQLTPEFREKLLANQELPAFCFPLVAGKKFATELPAGFTPSKVVGTGRGSGFTPSSVSDQAFRVEIHLFAADTTRFWFEKGVGITGLWDWHNGSYSEYRVRLVKFEPAKARNQAVAGTPAR